MSLQLDVSPSPCLHCGTPTNAANGYCCRACVILADPQWLPALSSPTPSRWQAYDDPGVRAEFNLSPTGETLRLHFFIEGLQCSSCVHLLEKLPEYDSRIQSARVRFGESELFVEASPDMSPGSVAAIIESMGYTPRFLRPTDSSVDLHQQQNRDQLRRLGVAGACAGNIMLLSVAIYGGADGFWKTFLHSLSVILFLPILFYSALPFYRGAWSALKVRRLNVDVPLVIAFWGGFVASILNLIRGTDGVYLDSTAGFLFLILVSRWFLRQGHRRWLDSSGQRPWQDEIVRVITADGFRPSSAQQLQVGDLFEVTAGQSVPVDAVLESSTALLDVSLITGESLPRVFQRPQEIQAGLTVLEKPLRARALTTTQTSSLNRLLLNIEKDSFFKSQRADLFDRASQKLLLFVLAVGLLMTVGGPLLGLTWDQSFQRALSLWIVACPCALAFGGPLAYGIALKEAARRGIFIKSADVFDRVAEVKSVIFDKTGTLTEGRLRLVDHEPLEIPPLWKRMILQLEAHSLHPVAYAFREAWQDQIDPDQNDVTDIHEVIGHRIFGLYHGQVYGLRAGNPASPLLEVVFCQDQNVLARFHFSDVVRTDAKPVLDKIRDRYPLFLLSGDSQARAEYIAPFLNLLPTHVIAGQTPEAKLDFIRKQDHPMMIGDGANDAPALAAAHVGVAVSGALEQSLRSADVYFGKKGLNPLLDLLLISRETQRTVYRNLAFALCYNIVAGSAALLGWVNPLVAALLMPLSSLLILASSGKAFR